jgi:integrase/recombinase XerC
LEKKGIHALKSYLAARTQSITSRVFLNYQGEPISERGIRKLVVKYRKEAGITKKASCHTLRHTFATYKAEKGVSAYQLQQWLGHANSSCKFFGDSVRLCGSLLREPQLLPLLIEFDYF